MENFAARLIRLHDNRQEFSSNIINEEEFSRKAYEKEPHPIQHLIAFVRLQLATLFDQ